MSETSLAPAKNASLSNSPRVGETVPITARRGTFERCSQWLLVATMAALVVVVAKNLYQAHRAWERVRSLRCDAPIHEFDRAFVGDTIHHTFRVVNSGRSPLKMRFVRPDCGCTTIASEIQHAVIEPGQSLDVPVQLDLAKTGTGDIVRNVMLDFEGDPTYTVTLQLKGTVQARWKWVPSSIDFGTISSDGVCTRILALQNNTGLANARILSASTTTNEFSARLRESNDPGGANVNAIEIVTVPPLLSGVSRAELYVYTSDSYLPVGPIPIVAQVK